MADSLRDRRPSPKARPVPLAPSPRHRWLARSPIRQMTIECARAGGVNLAQGICDIPVPEAVSAAAREAIAAGRNAYAPAEGLDELRAALATKMRRHADLDYAPEEVIVTGGATGAFYVAVLALLEPGDGVLLLEPTYGYHVNTLHALGLVPVYVRLEPPAWTLDVGAIEAACTPGVRAIVLNTPGNPSGKVLTREELVALGEIAERHDLVILTDEVYEHFVYDGRVHVSPATIPGLRERTVTISALSKTFAITGWRIGWLAAPRALTDVFAALSDLVYVCAPTPLQAGCARGLEVLPDAYYRDVAAAHQRKRDRLCAALTAAGLPAVVPEGSYFTLADVSRLPGRTGGERAMALLDRVGVAAVPGEAFYRGPLGATTARFCFGKTDADLDEACARLGRL
jgi:aminotransferase